jgi:hypothetical protein
VISSRDHLGSTPVMPTLASRNKQRGLTREEFSNPPYHRKIHLLGQDLTPSRGARLSRLRINPSPQPQKSMMTGFLALLLLRHPSRLTTTWDSESLFPIQSLQVKPLLRVRPM